MLEKGGWQEVDGYYYEHDDVILKGSPVKLDPVLVGHRSNGLDSGSDWNGWSHAGWPRLTAI